MWVKLLRKGKQSLRVSKSFLSNRPVFPTAFAAKRFQIPWNLDFTT